MRRAAGIFALTLIASSARAQGWDMRAAAAYLDARQTWWSAWPTAARDHQTACVSCHTALPYALARPSLRTALRESEPTSPERKLLDDVAKRVRMWRDVEPFYPDQTNGLPKTSESRGTHQDSATGKWTATSLNRRRDPATAAANFMSDAATGFAILALTYRSP